MKLSVAGCLFAGALAAQLLTAQSMMAQSMISGEQAQNPLAGKKEAIAAGAARFKEGCAACHGANGEGGRGPRLVKNWDLFRMTDQQLFNTVRKGIPGTSMPPSQMTDEKTWQVVSFVRSLSSPASRSYVEGNADHGKELFSGAGQCSTCHAIRGKGGLYGPDLSDAGAHLTVGDLREALKSHTEMGTNAVTVHLKNGAALTGAVRDDAMYSMAVMTRDGQLKLIDKENVRSVQKDGAPLLPEAVAEGLSASDMQDLVAFLAQQVIRTNLDTQARRFKEIH